MSSTGFAATLELRPRASRRAHFALFALHGAVLLLLMATLPPGLPLMLAAVAVGLSWLWLRRHPVFGYGPRALTRLIWHADGAWQLRDAAGREFEATLAGDSHVQRHLLVLRFRLAPWDVRSRVLLGDELPEEQQRRLRARLRGGTAPAR